MHTDESRYLLTWQIVTLSRTVEEDAAEKIGTVPIFCEPPEHVPILPFSGGGRRAGAEGARVLERDEDGRAGEDFELSEAGAGKLRFDEFRA